MNSSQPLIVRDKKFDDPSSFIPENLLREARRQKKIPEGRVPQVCILDPDGDIVRHLLSTHKAEVNPYWAGYHTELFDFEHEGVEFGIIGCAVGASFAVIVAEQLFVSGCELLISVTSSGMILHAQKPPFFVLIEKALRDEGTSYHYLPPADFSYLNKQLSVILEDAFAKVAIPVKRGATWTTRRFMFRPIQGTWSGTWIWEPQAGCRINLPPAQRVSPLLIHHYLCPGPISKYRPLLSRPIRRCPGSPNRWQKPSV